MTYRKPQNSQKHNDIAVIWLDAHGDLNTPDSSPSKHFHGMPLRSLLGEGSSDVTTAQAFSTLKPAQIFLVGARELDQPERRFVQQNRLSVLSTTSVNKNQTSQLFSEIEASGLSKIYVHLDL